MKNKKLNAGQTNLEIQLGDKKPKAGQTNVEIRIGEFTTKLGLRLPLTDALKKIILEQAALTLGALSPEFKEKYEKAYFGKLWRSNEKRAVFEFLSMWLNRNRTARDAGEAIADRELVMLLSPLRDALNKLDVMFFKSLLEACPVRELSNCCCFFSEQVVRENDDSRIDGLRTALI
jgi:hypothetical protein